MEAPVAPIAFIHRSILTNQSSATVSLIASQITVVRSRMRGFVIVLTNALAVLLVVHPRALVDGTSSLLIKQLAFPVSPPESEGTKNV